MTEKISLDGLGVDLPPSTEPKRGPGRPRGSKNKIGGNTTSSSMATTKKRITEIIRTMAGVIALRDPYSADVIGMNADRLGNAYSDVAAKHPKALKALQHFESGGVYGAALIATAGVVLPIGIYHGWISPNFIPLASIVSADGTQMPTTRQVEERPGPNGPY